MTGFLLSTGTAVRCLGSEAKKDHRPAKDERIVRLCRAVFACRAKHTPCMPVMVQYPLRSWNRMNLFSTPLQHIVSIPLKELE